MGKHERATNLRRVEDILADAGRVATAQNVKIEGSTIPHLVICVQQASLQQNLHTLPQMWTSGTELRQGRHRCGSNLNKTKIDNTNAFIWETI